MLDHHNLFGFTYSIAQKEILTKYCLISSSYYSHLIKKTISQNQIQKKNVKIQAHDNFSN